MDGWMERAPRSERKKSEVEGKAIQHPWSRKEDWRELSSGGNAEALGSSDRYDQTQ